jgi:RND family efflux transporter MFP subunit
MSAAARVAVSWTVLVAGALVLLVAGAGATYLSLRSSSHPPPVPRTEERTPGSPAAPPDAHEGASVPTTSAPRPDVVVPFSEQAAERAGVTVTPVTVGAASGALRAPAVVEPNAYKLAAITPLIGGRITRVMVELGQHVQPGQIVAQIFSPELAEWQTRYISARAELEAHERELARTEKLVEIGAASRQELERLHAEHTAGRAGLQSAASRLRLLGLSEQAIERLDPARPLDTTIGVPAPMAGAVTERMANVGLNVDQASKLFTVVDLSTVWVVASVYERDFSRVPIGASARVTTSAYPDLALQGRVSCIDPQVSAESRTAKVRIEVPNARGELRLGMFVEVVLGGAGTETSLVPRSAVQNVGDRAVVYLVNPAKAGEFVEREVQLGVTVGDHVSVLAGVRPGDVVVAVGSFSVRAERERLGLKAPAVTPTADVAGLRPRPTAQSATIAVGTQGYEPSRVSLQAAVPARLTFVRTTDATCGTEVSFPSLGITRSLPLKSPVVIAFTPATAGELSFICGMKMLKGTVVIQ